MARLKNCPFCGGKAHVMQMGFPHWVYCEKCGARVNAGTFEAKDSVVAWNKRVSDEKTRKCGECQYLNTEDTTHSVGFPCRRPNHYWRTPTAYLKYKHTPACRDFKPREEKGKK